MLILVIFALKGDLVKLRVNNGKSIIVKMFDNVASYVSIIQNVGTKVDVFVFDNLLELLRFLRGEEEGVDKLDSGYLAT